MSGFVLPATQASGIADSSWANAVVAALAAQTNPARALMLQATTPTAISSSSSAWTALAWDDIVLDPLTGWVAGHPTRWTCPVGWDGYYLCVGDVEFTADSTVLGVRRATFGHNGAAITGRCPGYGLVPNNGNVHIQVVHEMFLNAGDYVELFAQQSRGSALSTSINGVKTSSLSVCWKAVA